MQVVAVGGPPEIADLGYAKLQNDVLGLDVAVDEAHPVQVSQPLAEALGDGQYLVLLEPVPALQLREN